MDDLPPLDALRAFDAAARHDGFVAAGQELGVTAATISHRVQALEKHLRAPLFARHPRGVRLNTRGRAYAEEIRRILKDIRTSTERHRDRADEQHLKLVAVEVVAEKWLMPRLVDFKAGHPDISIEFETDHREVDPERREFDVWIAFTDRVDEALHVETLFEETLLPVCSPGLLKAQGQPREPADLHGWPLLYDLHWTTYWSHWFAHHGAGTADLSKASGFRLYSMMVQAAAEGMGVALGHSLMIARELEQGTLVSLFDSRVTAPARYLLVTTPAAISKPQVQAFRGVANGRTMRRRWATSGAVALFTMCAVRRRQSAAGANPARQLSLQPVAVGADGGGNDIRLKHSDATGRLGRLSDHTGHNAQ